MTAAVWQIEPVRMLRDPPGGEVPASPGRPTIAHHHPGLPKCLLARLIRADLGLSGRTRGLSWMTARRKGSSAPHQPPVTVRATEQREPEQQGEQVRECVGQRQSDGPRAETVEAECTREDAVCLG